MKIEFTYNEVINFIRTYSLFKKKTEERTQILIENGILDDNLPFDSMKQKYNHIIYDTILFSKLIKNSFWEKIIKDITDNDISILDHKDESISGVCCDACGYIVFEDKEDWYYEICPVCRWQNDGKIDDEYSGCNHCTLNEFKKTKDFNDRLALGNMKYISSSK